MTDETWRYVLRVDGRDIELQDGEVTLGRSRTATVRVDHESVSRTHAMVTLRKGEGVVKDLNSSNGTYVSGRRVVNDTRLADGDRIQLGAAVVGFKVLQPGAPTDKVPPPEKESRREEAAAPVLELDEPPPPPPPLSMGSSYGVAVPAPPAPPAPAPPPAPPPIAAAPESPAPSVPVPLPLEPIEAPPSLRPERPAPFLPPPLPAPQPIPLDLSGPMEPKVLLQGAELAAAAREAVKASPPAPPPAREPAPPPPPLSAAPPAPPAVPPTPPREPRPRRAAPERPPVPDATLSRVPIHGADEPAAAPAARATVAERSGTDSAAGFLPRLAAYLVDSVILLALNITFMTPVFLIVYLKPKDGASDWPLILVSTLCLIVMLTANFWYLIGNWAKSGRTPGKALLGLTIVATNGDRAGGLGWRTALMRALGYMVSSFCLGIGFLVILFREDRRGWHDQIAGTTVVWRR